MIENSWDAITLQASCLILGWAILVQYLKLNCFQPSGRPAANGNNWHLEFVASLAAALNWMFNRSTCQQSSSDKVKEQLIISPYTSWCQTCFPISQLNGWFLFSSLPPPQANQKSFCSTSLGNHPRTVRLPTVTKNFRLIGGGDVRKHESTYKFLEVHKTNRWFSNCPILHSNAIRWNWPHSSWWRKVTVQNDVNSI